ncbi:TetR/AcrR family transcriptional regulator [Streptomyces orinoci]|uniref:TetR/AcrR family transcriptional regulator n=1 Tax=Streptomyces orinoci TaxID=67339 RepID=A0ABV3JVL3_STRON|nr:TetR/AcrR family transcriptional regulator [Streptomyces orinoci]
MTTGARRRMDVEQRREQLTAVALELFARRSPESVSLDDIAGAAGISRPLVYHYFAGKPGLYQAALRRAADELTGLLTQPCEGPPGKRLLTTLGRFFDFVEAYGPGLAALRGSTAAEGLLAEVRHTAYRQLLAQLEVSAPGARLEVALRSWLSQVETTAALWLDGRRIPRPELELQLVQGLAALTAVGAVHDDGMAELLRSLLAKEPEDTPFGLLAARLAPLAVG